MVGSSALDMVGRQEERRYVQWQPNHSRPLPSGGGLSGWLPPSSCTRSTGASFSFPIAARQFVVVGLLIVAVAAIVTGGLALFRFRDRSVLLVTALVLMMLAASLFALGELLLPH
jgi:hypothetical protein